jgi:hypothetical protein
MEADDRAVHSVFNCVSGMTCTYEPVIGLRLPLGRNDWRSS